MQLVNKSSSTLRSPKMAACRAAFAARRSTSRVGYHRSAPVRALLEDVVTYSEDLKTEALANLSATTQTMPPSQTPGAADRQRFRLHWSVDMWRDFNPRNWLDAIDNEAAPVSERLRAFADTVANAVSTSGVFSSIQAAQYWAYHVARSSFFAAQAIAGLAVARATAGRDLSPDSALTRFEQIARNGWQGPLAEAFLAYYQDYESIKEGKYGMPWDGVSLTHRQFNPLYIARRAIAFVSEASDTLRRRDRGTPDEVWIKSAFLPDYYQSTFHYQSDGWMSTRSADVYETSTEVLFVGRQDSMQRSTLVPMSEFMAGKDASQIKALEIAAGTGRFATFVKDNYPLMDLTVSDLSPYYLQAARNNMKYWKRQRASELTLSGVDGNGTSFMQGAAEALPVVDASFDLVYSVYLFHELPEDIRRKAVKEMARVVKPGGMVILTDSVQLGDRPAYDATLGGFGKFNEPYYENYLTTDLGAIFEEAGLECDMKVMSSTTKSLSFKKPLEIPLDAASKTEAEEMKGEEGVVITVESAKEGDPMMN
ncbi:hypothetical protein Ndes2437B_g07203 [Nannochloris sp. 'desiccata']